MKNFGAYLITIVLLCSIPLFTIAQEDPPDDPVDVPVDGGLSVLLAAGIVYGTKKVYDKKKNGKDYQKRGIE